MGLTFAQGHFYAMFVAVFAFLTPPVAVVALIASRVAKASYIRTSIESTKAALGGFLLPFLLRLLSHSSATTETYFSGKSGIPRLTDPDRGL